MVQTILDHPGAPRRTTTRGPTTVTDQPRLRAVLFDLDGLTVDSEPLHNESIRRALADEGRPFDEGAVAPYLGRPARDSSAHFARLYGFDVEGFHERREGYYLALVEDELPFRPRLLESVALIRAAGLRLALVTSGVRDYAEAALRHLRAAGIDFEVVVTREDVTRAKPDPEPYLTAARLLGVDPAACAVLEDAPSGVESARRAGMTVVVVPNDHTVHMSFPGADAIVADLEMAVRWLLDRDADPTATRPGHG
jgi:HAD superfamily hydrolase (TIGR01509 family)